MKNHTSAHFQVVTKDSPNHRISQLMNELIPSQRTASSKICNTTMLWTTRKTMKTKRASCLVMRKTLSGERWLVNLTKTWLPNPQSYLVLCVSTDHRQILVTITTPSLKWSSLSIKWGHGQTRATKISYSLSRWNCSTTRCSNSNFLINKHSPLLV